MKKEMGYRHTDLALELQEEQEGKSLLSGVSVENRMFYENRIKETIIRIEKEEASQRLGKPLGTYITLESEKLSGEDDSFHQNMSCRLSFHLKQMIKEKEEILIAGLGNAEVTPDSLGPLVVKNLLITRHLTEYEEYAKMRHSMAVAPGVMAQTGMETGEILQSIVKRTKPDVLVVIDALAAKNFERLNTMIQICDSGIAPGSGVGNRRQEISSRTMGIPVIAIGVPTVISIPAIAGDILTSFAASGEGEAMRHFLQKNDAERYEYLAEILHEKLYGFFVTPKEIDESVKRISYTISEGLNRFIAKKA